MQINFWGLFKLPQVYSQQLSKYTMEIFVCGGFNLSYGWLLFYRLETSFICNYFIV